ncbi:retinaldehyde-binding protein 1-like [Diabrotica virgifera virgifera]|uniref:CRAL-TRIO domain-containing protein n=1 Tax=Diabrotica virgifera virgifera TaxID=50390 RepID=A0ABM5KC02_DIAVI|nr:retinaldehyde-binding protein 1-like [Diabrotica virgifera virgifera]
MSGIWDTLDYIARKKEIALDKENLLSSEKFEKAKHSLRETDSVKKESLVQLRNWIQQNRDIENCIIDDSFLLRFLRVKKHSIPMAQQTLLKYLNFRQKFRHVLCNLDYKEDKTSELFDAGYIVVSPFRDRDGRRVVFYNFKLVDLDKMSSLDVQRADAITFETLVDNEETQVMGITHVICAQGAGASCVPLFTANEFGYLIKWGEQSFPMRHRQIYLVHISPFIKRIYDIVKGLISPKLRSRVHFDDDAEKIKKDLGAQCLPKEMGGVVPLQEMVELFKEELKAKRERILSYDNIKLLSDQGIIRKKNPSTDNIETGSVNGSFRKLNID